MLHVHTDRQTDQNNGTLYAPRYEEAFLPYRKITASVSSLPRPCLITSREVNKARRPHTCSRPCAFEKKKSSKKKTKNPAPPETHHEIYSSPATATTSRRCAKKHDPHVSPYFPASIDPGFVEIGLVQLLQSVKTTSVTHRQTDRLIKQWHPVRI